MSKEKPRHPFAAHAGRAGTTPPAVYRPQPVPKVLQTKSALPSPVTHAAGAPPNPHRPAPKAPPAYSPQPTPKVLQQKPAAGSPPTTAHASQAPRRPALPHERPLNTPHVLQRKTGPAGPRQQPQPRPQAAPPPRNPPQPPRVLQRQTPNGRATTTPAPARGVVQRFAWAIHSSNDSENEQKIVNENLKRAKKDRYVQPETVTDPEKVNKPRRINLGQGEPIHIHAHGNDDRVGGFGAESLAREILRKFDAADLVGRTIVFHSCESGSGEYPKQVLERLVAEATTVKLVGTKIFAPVNYLVVNKDGLSYVAKENAQKSALKNDDTRGSSLRALGQGWRGWVVGNDDSVTEIGDVATPVTTALSFVEAVETRYKPEVVEQPKQVVVVKKKEKKPPPQWKVEQEQKKQERELEKAKRLEQKNQTQTQVKQQETPNVVNKTF